MLPSAGLEINTRVELKNYLDVGEANSGLGNRRWGGIPAFKIRDRLGRPFPNSLETLICLHLPSLSKWASGGKRRRMHR